MSQLKLTHGSVKAMFEDDLMKIFCSDLGLIPAWQ